MRYVFRTKPYEHQKKNLKRFIKQHYLGVLWDPGIGKSKLIVDCACALNMMGKLNRVLIVCPLSVVGVWQDEFEKHATTPYYLENIEPDTHKLLNKKRLHIVVVNYDLVWRRDKLVSGFDPQMVVADESHRIKKASARRSWYLRRYNDAPYRAILTGTPSPKSLLDLYSQWVFLQPKTFGTRVQDFKDRYIIYGGFKNYEIKGYRNVKELKRKLKKDSTRLRKDQTLDLPERIWQRVPVLLEPRVLDAYWELADEFLLTLKSGAVVDAKNAMVKMMKLQQITGGWVFDEDGVAHRISNAKMGVMKDIFQTTSDNGSKIVVFARFRREVKGIAALARKAGLATFVLDGDTPREERRTNRIRFQSNPEPAAFVAQVASGGLGITLTASSEAVFYSAPLPLDEYIQACDRIHRIGQTRMVRYRHLVATGTVDEDIYRALKKKQEVMAIVMGKPSSLTGLNQTNTMKRPKGGRG